MKELFALVYMLASAWLCIGLRFPNEYEFVYGGIISLGVPDVKEELQSFMMTAKVILQIRTKDRGVGMLKDVHMTNTTFTIGQESCASNLNQFKLTESIEELKQPFAFHLSEDEDGQMIVAKGEKEYITNILKSVVDSLRIVKITEHLEEARRKGQHYFSFMQNTMFGRCLVHYTFRYAHVREVNQEYKKLSAKLNISSEWEQSSIAETMDFFRIEKTAVDFDTCKDKVVLQRTSMGKIEEEAGGNLFKSLQSRSSRGFSVVATEGGAWEQIIGESENDVITSPFGVHSEQLLATTSKIVVLLTIQEIKRPIPLPRQTQKVRTQRFEVASSFPASKNQKSWINYHHEGGKAAFPVAESFTTGIRRSEFVNRQTKLHATELLREATKLLMEPPSFSDRDKATPWEGPGALDSSLLLEAMKIVQVLSQEEIESLFRKLKRTSGAEGQIMSMLFIDVAASSGTAEAVRFLLREMKAGNLPVGRVASIWATMTNHLSSSDVVPEIMDFVMELEPSHHSLFLSSMAHVNFAALANKFCINPSTAKFTTERELFGDGACQGHDILRRFLPYVEKRIKDSARSNETAYLIQTLSNLGSSTALPILTEVATNSKFTNQVRTLAIFAMEKRKMGEDSQEQVFGVLMEVLEDTSQKDELRLTAFIALITWHPGPSWWHHMARRTWLEPSENVAGFITLTIKAVSKATSPSMVKQAAIAAFAEPFAKPVPASFAQSFNYVYAKFLPREELDTRFHFKYLPAAFNSLIPGEVYAHLSGALGGFDFNLFEIAASSFGFSNHLPNEETLEGWRSYRTVFGSSECGPPFYFENERIREAASFLQKLSKNGSFAFGADQEANILLRFFDNIYTFLPITLERSSPVSSNCKFDYRGEVAKFFNPFSSEIFLPTEIGIPIVFQNSLSVLSFANYTINSSFPCSVSDWDSTPKQNIKLKLQSDLRVSGKLFSRVKAFVPMMNMTLMVGVDNVKAINLPFSSSLHAIKEPGSGTLAFRLESLRQHKFPLVYAHNIPFRAIKPLFPLRRLPAVSDLQVLYVNSTPLVKRDQKLSCNTAGLNFTLDYLGTEAFPFTSVKFMDTIRNPQNFLKLLSSPTTKLWRFSLNFDPAISDTKTINIRSHYDLFSHGMENPNSSVQETLQKLSERTKTLHQEKNAKRLKKAFKLQGPYGSPFSITFLDFNGAKEGNQIRFMTVFSKRGSTSMMNKFFIAFLFSKSSPNSEKMFNQQCLVKLQTPNIKSLDGLKAFIHSDRSFTYDIDIKPFDYERETKSYATVQGSMGLSKSLRARILEDLNSGCVMDGKFALEDFHTFLAYDELSLSVKYRPQLFLAEVLNATYRARDWAKGNYFPHFSSNRMDVRNKEDTILLKGYRPLPDSDVYLLRIQCPRENIAISNFKMPLGVDTLVPYSDLASWDLKDALRNDILGPSGPYCQITSRYTKTFDGLKINFPLTACPSIAAVDISTLFTWLLYTRYNEHQEPEINLLCFSHCITVVASATSLKINGKELPSIEKPSKIKDWYGYTVLEVESNGPFKRIDFFPFLAIEIRNHSVTIEPKQRMKGLFRGMCGDFDGNPENDMTGPMLCSYDSPELFGSSWIIPSFDERCNKLQWLHDLEKKMEIYQKVCPIRPS